MSRVLHLGKYFPPFSGGIENFMGDLLPATRAAGFEVAALVHRHEAGDMPAVDFPVWRVPTHGELIHAPLSPGFRAALVRAIHDWRPDLLHVHMPNTSAFWLLSLRGLRLPVVVHWHADVLGPGVRTALRLAYLAYRPLEAALLERAAAVIATSPGYLASSTALARWRDKCTVIPLGLAPRPVAGREAAPATPGAWSTPGALRVLAVGRLSAYKGFDVLVRALAGLRGIELVIAGDGEQAGALRRLVSGLGLEGRVRLAGRVDDAARDRLLHDCDLLCLPSVNRNEAFGLVLLEAMAVGKPSLVTRVPGAGMSWVVEDGTTGWHVEPGDVDALGRRLSLIRDNRGMLASLGRNALTRFQELFAIESVARRTIDLYRSVL